MLTDFSVRRCASAVAMALCPSVRPSVTSSIKTDERIRETTLNLNYTVQEDNWGISKSKGTALWNFVLNTGIRKCRNCTSIVASVVNLGGRSVW